MVLIKLKDLVLDQEYYPRKGINWKIVQRYKRAMEAGAQFPEILVGKKSIKSPESIIRKGERWVVVEKYVVLDGWHRVKAVQDLRRESIGASITSAPESEWFLEAVKANIMHGMQFSNSEIVKLILELENQGITRGKIGEIVRIPAQSIERFVNQHITREKPNEPIRKIGQSAPASASKDQERIALLDKIIQILEKDFAELNTEAIKERLKKIKELIEKLHL